jgi:LPS-assembly lipoprotein
MSLSERRRRLLAAAALAALPPLAGCGFELRQPPRLGFTRIALTGFAPRSPMAEELQRQMGDGVTVVATPASAQVVLQALTDQREKSVVASTAAAQVREQQLRLKLVFRAHTPGGRELIPRTELLVSRDMSFSETTALAKEREEAELFRDMQADIGLQVLRRLASLVL